jgi:YHS domain-containing protein/thiol-disulfide isomerase/thioredoxin
MRSPQFAFSLCLLAAYGWVATVSAEELTPATVWMTSFAKAQAEAKRLHRPLVVHFHTATCPPCRKMEKEVLHTPQVLKLLDKGFIAVKVDLSKPLSRKLQTQYRVEAMPTDMILDEDGKALVDKNGNPYRTEGYAGGSTGERKKYIDALTAVDVKYVAEGKRLPRTDATLVATQQTPAAKAPAAVATNGAAAGGKLVPEPVEPRLLEDSAEPAIEDAVGKPIIGIAQTVIALDGYCPVTLRTTRTWKKGDQQIALNHEGQTFLFLAADKRDEFQSNPARYAPKLLGCDPVVLAESNLAIRGSTKYGAFYEGELYLFESNDTRAKFRKEPTRFIRLKHVLRPEEVKDRKDVSNDGKLTVTAVK